MRYFGALLTAICLLSVPLSSSAQRNLSLSDALSAAKATNPILKIERLNINVAQSDLTTAKLRPNPALNNQTLQLANSSYFAVDSRWNSPVNRQVWWQVTKQFQWPALRENRIDFATQQIKFTENGYFEFERNLIFEVAQKWLDAWHAKQLLITLQQAQLNLDSLITIQRARLKNQVITTTELTRTQIPLAQYNLQLKSIRQEYLNSVQELKLLIGTPDSIDVSTIDVIERFRVSARPDSLMEIVLQNRPDVKTIQSALTVSESNIKLQRSQKWPVPELGVIWNPQNTIPYLGFFGTIQIPLFSRNQGGIEKSLFLKQQAEQNLENVRLKITTEMTVAYQSYLLQREILGSYTQIVQQANEVLRSVRYSYLKGGTTLIDLLEAQRSWYDTQRLYFEAQSGYYQSYLKLLFITGLITQL